MAYSFDIGLSDLFSSPLDNLFNNYTNKTDRMVKKQASFDRAIGNTGKLVDKLNSKLQSLEVKKTIEIDDSKIKKTEQQIDKLKARLNTLPSGGGGNSNFGTPKLGGSKNPFSATLPMIGNPYLVAGTMAAAGLTYAAKLGMDRQSTLLDFEQFVGKHKAASVVANLNKYADKTSYENDDVLQAGALLSQNVSADKIEKKMAMFGDLSRGKAENLNRNIFNYAQVKGIGKTGHD
ncbi:hypothetical protein ACFFJX_08070 [Pseudarcicella hirudinis]|uniref:hypothetical protein n=1 Tax=Pseudarcicella hirudinis TaxID=1079859 RepID=UPI0035E93680